MDRTRERALLLSILLLFGAFYIWQLAPSLQWGDPSKLLRVALDGEADVLGGGGHGLLVILIRLLDLALPGGVETAARYSSPIFALISLVLLWQVLRRAGIGAEGRLLGVSALGVSHLFWSVTEIVESYALLGLTTVIWLLAAQSYAQRPHWGRALGLLAVLAVGALNHQLLFLLFPVQLLYFAVTLEPEQRRAWLGIHGGFALMGVIGAACLPEAAGSFVSSVGYHLERWVHPEQILRQAVLVPAVLVVQFPGLAILCGGWGLWVALRRRTLPQGGLLVLASVVIASFALSYGVGRGVYLMLPVYIFTAIFVASGWHHWVACHGSSGRRFGLAMALVLAVPVAGYALSWRVCNQLGVYPVSSRTIAYRDVNRYYLWPGKRGEDGPERFVESLEAVHTPGALVLADFRIASVLQCAGLLQPTTYEVANTDHFAFLTAEETRGHLQGVIEKALGQGQEVILADPKSVEFATSDQGLLDLLPELEARYRLEPVGDFHRIERPSGLR